MVNAVDDYYADWHSGLKAGTVLRHMCGTRIRLVQDMHTQWAYCEYIRKDGRRDRRRHGFSAWLRKTQYVVEAV
jgi:hypothetical protein